MAGHSKWSQIKRKKGANDKKRSAMYSKHIRAIGAAVRSGGSGDPSGNLALKNAIAAAKTDTVPVDNIDNAIKRALGAEAGAAEFKEVTYEGYGPGGTAILVAVATDNRNRTVAEVRHAFSRAGGNLGETGSVGWQFEPKGIISVAVEKHDPDDLVMQAIDAGADDVQLQGETVEVQTDPADLEAVRKTLESSGLSIENADYAMVPKVTIELEDKTAHSVLKLLDALEDLEDVQRVYSNADFSDSALESYAG